MTNAYLIHTQLCDRREYKFIKHLRHARITRGLSQDNVVYRSKNLGQNIISKIENMQCSPNMTTILEYLLVLNINPNKLFGDTRNINSYENMDELRKIFISNCVKRRKELNITRKKIMNTIGIPNATLYTLEVSTRNPQLYNLIRYLYMLEININDIFK